MKKILIPALIFFAMSGCGDEDNSVDPDTQKNEDIIQFEKDHQSIVDACQNIFQCGLLNEGTNADDCIEVQAQKYADIQLHCADAEEIFYNYEIFWKCEAAATCAELEDQDQSCANGNITLDLLAACGFDV